MRAGQADWVPFFNTQLVHRMDAVPFVSKWYETCKSRSVKAMVKELGLEVRVLLPQVPCVAAKQLLLLAVRTDSL